MKRFLRFIPALAGGLLIPHAYADGAGMADTLNHQWQSVAESCTTQTGHVASALTCSGVLVKPLPDTAAEKMMAAGGVLFLRKDLKTPPGLTGMVLPAGSALSSNEKVPAASCARPVAVANDTVRAAFGCGDVASTPSSPEESDSATCNQQDTGPQEADWKWDGSCTLSASLHQEFSKAIMLSQNTATNPGGQAMQVWYRHWPATVEAAKPQALVFTAGDTAALKARQADRARLKQSGQDVPVLKYTVGAQSPFSYTPADNVEPMLPDRNTVQKTLDKLFANGAEVRFLLVPPSVTKTDSTVHLPEVNATTNAVKIDGYTEAGLTFSIQYNEFKNMSPQFQNLSDSAILYGFIVDNQLRPVASVYGPYGSQKGRAAAVALAKRYNTLTHSMLPVATMNINSTSNMTSASAAFDFKEYGAFQVVLVGNEGVIQPGPDDSISLEEKANKVIARYSDTHQSCTGGTPAWQCSGLIIRATGSTHPFTQSKDVVTNRGVASYTYLRQDTNTVNMWANNQAIVLKVPDSASASTPAGEKLLNNLNKKLKCIYPHDADTVGNHGVILDFQCHKINTAPSNLSSNVKDYSDCATVLNLPANTPDAQAWIDKWHSKKYTWSYNQCALSVQHAGQFYAAIKLTTEKVGDYTWNELILEPSSEPGDIPEIEAVLYQNSNDGALNAAKEIARKYQTLRNVTLPLVGWEYSTHRMVFDASKQLIQ